MTTYRLDHFGFLKVTGKDAVSFLQGYTTCNLDLPDEQSVQLGAICNLQGRMLTSFLVIRKGTDLLLRMERPLVEKTITFLDKYIVFSKAELRDMSASLHCFGRLEISESEAAVNRQGSDITISLGNRSELWQPGDIADAVAVDHHWVDREIEQGIAWVNDSTSGKFLPQMFAYHELGGIDFDKGCYLGQEIVARMQYRGELKRRLHRTEKPVSELESGDVIATGSRHSLVVLNNTSGDEIEVASGDGSVTATPVSVG